MEEFNALRRQLRDLDALRETGEWETSEKDLELVGQLDDVFFKNGCLDINEKQKSLIQKMISEKSPEWVMPIVQDKLILVGALYS